MARSTTAVSKIRSDLSVVSAKLEKVEDVRAKMLSLTDNAELREHIMNQDKQLSARFSADIFTLREKLVRKALANIEKFSVTDFDLLAETIESVIDVDAE